MNAARLNIAIEVDDKGSVKIRQLGKTADDAGRKADAGFKKAGRSLNDFNSSARKSLGSINALYGAVVGAAFTAAFIKISSAAIQAASDLQEVSSKFDVVFKGQEQQAEQWSETLVESYAMSTRESKLYLSSVQDLLVPMGMAADQAGAMSNEVVKLSADLGSFNNLPTAQVMDDIQSALVGNYETMKKYGVVLNATSVQQKALEMGLAATKKELTAADKAQAAYKLMVEGSTAAIGDMVRTSDSYANQLKQMKARVEDIQAAFGQGLLPVMTDLLDDFNQWYAINGDLLDQDLQEWAGFIGDAVGELAGATRETVTALKELKPITDSLTGALGGYGESAKYGVVGYALFGPAGPLKIVAMLEVIRGAIPKIIDFNKQLANEQQRVVDTLLGLNDEWEGSVGHFEAAGHAAQELKNALAHIAPIYREAGEAAGDAANEACAANKKVLTCAEKKAAALAKIEAKTLKDHRKSVKDAVDYDIKYHSERYADTDMFMGKADADRRANEIIVEQNRQTVDTSINYWTDFTNQTQDILHDFVSMTLKGEFDDMGDFFDSALDSMLNMFVDWIAKMVANWAMAGLSELVINGTMSGFSLGGLSGGSGGSGIPSVSGSGAGMGTFGGSVAVAGGAYGVYQGGRDISNGNYVQGAAELGAGAYSTYQGAVALNLIEEGAATRIAQAAAQRIGMSGWSSGGSQTVTYGQSGTQYLGSLGNNGASPVVDYSVDSAGGYASGGAATYSTATTAANQAIIAQEGVGWGPAVNSGSSAGTGAAAYAGPATFAVIAATVLNEFWNKFALNSGPSAEDRSFGFATNVFSEATLAKEFAKVQDFRYGGAFNETGNSDNSTWQEAYSNASAGWHDAASTWSEAAGLAFDDMVAMLKNNGDEGPLLLATENLTNAFDNVGIEKFVESLSDIDMSAEQASIAMDLASEAASGSGEAFAVLDGYLQSLGMSSEGAHQATVGLLEAERRLGLVSTESTGSMYQLSNQALSMSSALEDVSNAQRNYNDALDYATSTNYGVVDSIMSGSYAMEQLSRAADELANTNINMEASATLRVNILGDNWDNNVNISGSTTSSSNWNTGGYGGSANILGDYRENYDGGIFLDRAIFRPGQTIAERGPEAAIPLRHPKQLNNIEDKIDSLGNRPIQNNITLKVKIDGTQFDMKILEIINDNSKQLVDRVNGVTL